MEQLRAVHKDDFLNQWYFALCRQFGGGALPPFSEISKHRGTLTIDDVRSPYAFS